VTPLMAVLPVPGVVPASVLPVPGVVPATVLPVTVLLVTVLPVTAVVAAAVEAVVSAVLESLLQAVARRARATNVAPAVPIRLFTLIMDAPGLFWVMDG
jgi:hypothetical protein